MAVASWRQRWQVVGLLAAILLIGYFLLVVNGPSPGSLDGQLQQLQIENRQLKIYLQEQQQNTKLLHEQIADLESLNKVQQQITQELRQGNEMLQNKLDEMQQDVQFYKESSRSQG